MHKNLIKIPAEQFKCLIVTRPYITADAYNWDINKQLVHIWSGYMRLVNSYVLWCSRPIYVSPRCT